VPPSSVINDVTRGGRTTPGDTIQGDDTVMSLNIFAAEFTRTLDKH